VGPPASSPYMPTDKAGGVGLVVGQPFDVVKVRYQTLAYAKRYSSTFGALTSILRDEKVRALADAGARSSLGSVADDIGPRSLQGCHVSNGKCHAMW
jgi:hypothetical protein